MSRSLPLVPVLLLLAGCADGEAVGLFDDTAGLDPQAGQTVLFVGTDPITLETGLWLVKALGDEADGVPELATANSFELEALDTIDLRGEEGLLQTDVDTLFSETTPFPVPDYNGVRIAVIGGTPAEDDTGPTLGRVAVFDRNLSTLSVGPEIAGLLSAHFSWAGGLLILERARGDGDLHSVGVLDPDDLHRGAEFYESFSGVPPGADVRFAGLEHGSDAFLVVAREPGLPTEVYRIDTDSSDAELLTDEVFGSASDPTLSSNGRWLAVSVDAEGYDGASIALVDLLEGTTEILTDGATSHCFWPAWSPVSAPISLAFVCEDLATERPDLARWRPGVGFDVPSSYLTAGAQPAVPSGMEGQIFLSRPQWAPDGSRLVFGSSSRGSGNDTALLVQPVNDEGLAESLYPVFLGEEGSIGWFHFSEAAGANSLLVWDRSLTGLQSSQGLDPIVVVPTDTSTPPRRGVSLASDLLVSYPMFLGQNSMFYP